MRPPAPGDMVPGTRPRELVAMVGDLLQGDGRCGPAGALVPAGTMQRHVRLS
jgi:hypothetical protein